MGGGYEVDEYKPGQKSHAGHCSRSAKSSVTCLGRGLHGYLANSRLVGQITFQQGASILEIGNEPRRRSALQFWKLQIGNWKCRRSFGLKEADAQWGQEEVCGVRLAVVGHCLGRDAAGVAGIASAIDFGVAVEHFLPFAPARQAHPVARPRHRRQVQ